MEKFCQSCAMPLQQKGADRRGTEKNGERSNKYCNYCYLNGKFTNPNATYDEVLKLGMDGIDKAQGSKFSKWLTKKSYPMLLKKCKRWR